ncbi:Wzz/FepE/Etk N-terminal domain-containing protein [Microbacter margulisiae]|uniref:Polysaccharide chain length determinant N-terminal domain-containing protein n=1 Tax=Microbacter margulisiae TaxID=1350067 RepID=A0A7W5H152_9PORP|nr:Wzz/FepE/Etk N-terminal domain-containing protein [Microbacter margulisiae]MBB3187218.1 hypothetical protein [Microbacter margulisiae]
MGPEKTNDEISLQEILFHLGEIKKLILQKKKWVVGMGLAGAVIGLIASFLIKPTYTATLSFAIQDDQSSSMSNISSLASQFGFSLGGGTSGAFGGDNLYALFMSHRLIENTLLQPVQIDGKATNLLNLYIDTYHLREGWAKSKNPTMRNMQFPVNQQQSTFTRAQDSILEAIYTTIIKKPMLTAQSRDKKLSIGDITFVSQNELLSQLFVENLIQVTTNFYVATKTKVARQNYETLLHQADSVEAVYDNAVASRAALADNAPNMVKQIGGVSLIRKSTDMQIAAATLIEMKKNLEVLKLSIDQDTPLVQVIDSPTLPLQKHKLGKAKGIVLGGLIGGFVIVMFLVLVYFYRKLKENLLYPDHHSKA